MKVVAIILARGGSKGIRNKNIVDFCGKPLLVCTIEHCCDGGIDLIYLSSYNNAETESIISIS